MNFMIIKEAQGLRETNFGMVTADTFIRARRTGEIYYVARHDWRGPFAFPVLEDGTVSKCNAASSWMDLHTIVEVIHPRILGLERGQRKIVWTDARPH